MPQATFYLWLKTMHIIFMVAWFSGLFYLPRLFVYHTMSTDGVSYKRFSTMERRLYYAIIYPGGVLTTICGMIMLHLSPERAQNSWFQGKLFLVAFLWAFHLLCGHYLRRFKKNSNKKSEVFFRIFNEFPTVILCCTIYLIVFKPVLYGN
ncbi:MAG: protoporphyrinogen oxidase HemJ [Legionellales bacterium]|jgi:protoporphyrinogen IX oxidase|nr:protoporphyrinogen oxidase HemJ [Legionellales bacterium]